MNNELEVLFKNENLKNQISEHLINHWKYLNIRKYCEKDDAIKFFIDNEKTKIDFVDSIEKELFPLGGKTILDVGCGKGGVLISCALRGAKAVGFDIDEEEVKIAKLRAKAYGIEHNVSIFIGNAENMPFSDNSFNVVIATSVFEHVKNLKKVIKEMVRVTKLGGFCCTTTPNPLFPREAHYKVFYIPYLPKKIGKIYLIIRGVHSDFFMKNVMYPYPSVSKIEKIFRKNGMDVQNITEKNILKKFTDPNSIRDKRIKAIIRCLKKIRVNKFIANLIVYFHFYPSVHLVAKKIKQIKDGYV